MDATQTLWWWGEPHAWLSLVQSAGAMGVLTLIPILVLAWMSRRFLRRWDSVDKRLSEVLWRTRHGDAEEIRRRTTLLEGQLADMLRYLKTVANTIDVQLEALSSEMRASLGKIDHSDSKNVGQNRMIIYQLERIRKQLKLLGQQEEQAPEGRVATSGRGGVVQDVSSFTAGRSESGYRVEAVFEPIRKRVEQARKDSSEIENLLQELTWDKR